MTKGTSQFKQRVFENWVKSVVTLNSSIIGIMYYVLLGNSFIIPVLITERYT